MPRYSRYNNNSFRYGRSTRRIATSALKIAKKVEDATSPEYKDYRIATIPVTMSNLGVVYDLIGNGSAYGGITQGAGNNDRIGDSIKLQRLVFRGLFQKTSTGTIASIRCMLFKGKSEEGVSYVTSDILESLSVYSGKNEANRYNSKIIYDEVFVVDTIKSGHVELDWNIPLNWHCQFEPGSTNVSNGGLWMLILTSAATNQPQWDGVFRISYTDA